jgi:hypothetical protein
MLHLKFTIAWFCSPLGLHRSVEEESLTPHVHAVRYATKKDEVAFLWNAGLGSYVPSTERCIPDGMQL